MFRREKNRSLFIFCRLRASNTYDNMSFPLLENQFSQADLDASDKKPVYVAVAVGLVLATGSVLLRTLARHKSKANFGWEDYAIVCALVSHLAYIVPFIPHRSPSLTKR